MNSPSHDREAPLQESAWYQQSFGVDYLQLYQHRSPQEAADTIRWLINELKIYPPANVLDLACGSGRHCTSLTETGFSAFGLDISLPLLVEGKKSGSYIEHRSVRGDMRQLPYKANCFDVILSLFTSFGYFSSETEDQQVLNEVGRVLTSGGQYVLDFLNAPLVESTLVPQDESKIRGKRVYIRRWIDRSPKRVEKRIYIHEKEDVIRQYRESVRLYTDKELRTMMNEAGLTVSSIFGNYDGSLYSKDSPRLILIGVKDA